MKQKNPDAVRLSKKAAKARKKIPKAKRIEIATKAAEARWYPKEEVNINHT